jgi:hypothetical protein
MENNEQSSCTQEQNQGLTGELNGGGRAPQNVSSVDQYLLWPHFPNGDPSHFMVQTDGYTE